MNGPQRCGNAARLPFPVLPAVDRMPDRPIIADGPTFVFIDELDGAHCRITVMDGGVSSRQSQESQKCCSGQRSENTLHNQSSSNRRMSKTSTRVWNVFR